MLGKDIHSARSNRMIAVAFMVLASVAATQSRADDDKTYTIKLIHPSHVGEKSDYTCNGFQKMVNVITIAGQPPVNQPQDLAVSAQGTLEVLAVDDRGLETKVSFTVTKFVRTDQNPPTEILPAGAVVIADATAGGEAGAAGSKTRYTLKDGTALPRAVVGPGDHPHGPKKPNEPSNDETFRNRQAAESRWGLADQ